MTTIRARVSSILSNNSVSLLNVYADDKVIALSHIQRFNGNWTRRLRAGDVIKFDAKVEFEYVRVTDGATWENVERPKILNPSNPRVIYSNSTSTLESASV